MNATSNSWEQFIEKVSGFLFWLSFEKPFGWFFGWLFDWPVMRLISGWVFEWLIDFLDFEAFCLRSLERSRIDEDGRYYPRLNRLGFYRVRHRKALTVFRKGAFISVLEAPHGHLWHHIWPRLRRDECGPEIDVGPTFHLCEYENVPTSLGMSLPERLRGQGQIISPPMGRPVNAKIKLLIGYYFKPQHGTIEDAVEKAIHLGLAKRNEQVCNLSRPTLERLTGLLSPIDLRLRLSDSIIIEGLKKILPDKLKILGYEVLSVEINTIELPDTLETAFIANQELLRQSIRGYSPDDLARMIATQMGQGMRTGAETVATTSFDPVFSFINHLASEGPPLTIEHKPPDKPEPPPGRWKA